MEKTMDSKIEDEEALNKYFLFSIMTEKKLPTSFLPNNSLYKVGSLIGKSSLKSTFVYAAQYRKTSELIAVKKYNMEYLNSVELKSIQEEINLMNQIRCPYLLTSLVSFVNGYDIVSILPLSEYGSCSDLIRKHFHDGLPEILINFILKDVLKALNFLHSEGIIHRAVKGSHILIGSNGNVKLSGLRYALKKNYGNNLLRILENAFEFLSHASANLKWLSPDILQQNLNGYNEKSDIYSLGITVCELANGVVPFEDCQFTHMLKMKVDGDVPDIYDFSTFEKISKSLDEKNIELINDSYWARKRSKHLHSFKNLCCILRPEDRPDAGKLLMHPFFKRIKQRKLSFDQILPLLPISDRNFTTNAGLEIPLISNCDTVENSCDWEF